MSKYSKRVKIELPSAQVESSPAPVSSPVSVGIEIDTDASSQAVFSRKRKSAPSETVDPDAFEEPSEVEVLKKRLLDYAPSWLISMVLHFLIMLVLALIFLPMPLRKTQIVDATYAEEEGDPIDLKSIFGLNDPESIDDFESLVMVDPVFDPMQVLPSAQMEILDMQGLVSEDINILPITLSLSGREPGQREGHLRKGGGTKSTQEAVELALKWIAKVQHQDGGWSLVGSFPDGVPEERENRSAATAMALLAFQGNGVTPNRGIQKENLKRGWTWLLKQQDESGCFYRDAPPQHRFYTQGFCTIAICELYHVTRDPEHRKSAEKAVEYCLNHQSKIGGWRYYPGSQDQDLSVTGWILMSLQSARMAGLRVPEENLAKIHDFLDTVALDGGSQYMYHKVESANASYTMTAEGLLCRQYLGWKRDDPRMNRGLEIITKPVNLVSYKTERHGNETSERNVYSWYYATQAAHHAGAPYWKKWNDVMRQEIPSHQVKTGREAGSWDPFKPSKDEWADYGGRLYVTCLSTYILEVYYRHLPIYRGIPSGYEEDPEEL